MAGNRTLKLSILADVDNLRKGLNQADGDVSGFGGKLDGFAAKAGVAFAAAGAAALAYAGKLAVDGVKAAIEDEAAQLRLATTLKNVTGATSAQTKAVEDYILKTELAYGVTDQELRPSLDRLVRSTKSVEEAQKLQTLALNIAAGTGRDLQQVSEALAKAHDGNFGALKRLGVSIDENIIKSKDFNAATEVLAKTFEDQASIQADTFDGKMRRLSVAFEEGKETIGSFLLDALQPIIDSIVNYVIPALTNFSGRISDGLQPVIKIFKPILQGLTNAFNDIKDSFVQNKDKLEPFFNLLQTVGSFMIDKLAPIIGSLAGTYFKLLGKEISLIIDVFANLVDFLTKVFDKIKAIIDFLKNNPISKFISGASFNQQTGNKDTAYANFVGGDSGMDMGGSDVPSLRRQLFGMTPKQQAEYERTKQETAEIRERIKARKEGKIFGSGNTTINVTGAIDPIATARTIANALGIEATTSGSFVNLGYSFV